MLDVCIAVHAEEAAILQAAKLGSTALNGAILYTTTFPCPLCSKSIINAGIKRVVFNEPYPLDDNYRMFKKMFEQCGMALDKFEGVNAWAFDRLFRAKLV
jgi:dCMP deaminase